MTQMNNIGKSGKRDEREEKDKHAETHLSLYICDICVICG